MKRVVLSILMTCLAGCSSYKPPSGKSYCTDPTDEEANRIVFDTMLQIHAELKALKDQFPQLENIESATVTSNCFRYSKGWISDSKRDGTTFEQHGGDILFKVEYPNDPSSINQLSSSQIIRIGNGKCLKLWRLVRSEKTEQGKQFRTQVNQILSTNIGGMLDALGHIKGDGSWQYPFMQKLIADLSRDDHERWESFYAACKEIDEFPVDSPKYSNEYEDGFRSGYAYVRLTNGTKPIGSRLKENTPKELAYVKGWFAGQLKAERELWNNRNNQGHNQGMDLTR